MRVRLGILTKQQTTSLENIQHRALQIIAGNIPYDEARCLFKLTSLSERRDSLCSKLFRQLVSQSHILHSLLPAQRDDSLTGRLRSRNKISNSRDQPFQKLIYAIRYSQLSITFAVFGVFVCISFMSLRVHVDLIQPLAARNNKRCCCCCCCCWNRPIIS